MLKQYRLLKDLPNQKVGVIFTKEGEMYKTPDDKNGWATRFRAIDVENNPEWFELVSTQWQPEKGEQYWIVTGIGEASNTSWADWNLDRGVRSFGNCFKTREQAEEAAKRVKQTLLDYQEELANELAA